MIIKIEQTLHGYETGHQLLMSSTPLSNDAKQALLVQSDLTGSNIDEHFKSYITGYPLSNYYAFSKTWYADEMRRPGCVWTHTLLISFPDLGKIPDLYQLKTFFKRPIKDQYDNYSAPIILDRDDVLDSPIPIQSSLEMTKILSAVYDKYDKTVLLPSTFANEYEDYVLQLWSNQWPRLRRNFSFCTGSLSLKSIGGKEFDLQVVPRRNILTVAKQTDKGFIVDIESSENPINEWIELLYNAPKNTLRRFLWLYGSDVSGTREHYSVLILIFGASTRSRLDFASVNKLIHTSFESPNEALRLKREIFKNDKNFHFDEREVLAYLLEADSNILPGLEDLKISQRLYNAYENNLISLQELVSYYLKAAPNRVSETLLDELIGDDSQLLSLIALDNRLIDRFEHRLSNIALQPETWLQPYDFQIKILRRLQDSSGVKWSGIIAAILSSNSVVILEALDLDYQNVAYALSWMNANDYKGFEKIAATVFNRFKNIFIDFIKNNVKSLSSKSINLLFQNLRPSEINSINLSGQEWTSVYHRITNMDTAKYASCVLLSFGFNRAVNGPLPLVVNCFSDVYYFAKEARISGQEWNILPVDMSEESYDRDIMFPLFNFFSVFSPKKNDVPSWDYCELLIRTLVNKFIKYKWPYQAFLDTLSNEHLTLHAIRYCLSFHKGLVFLKGIMDGVDKRKLSLGSHQIAAIAKISKEMF